MDLKVGLTELVEKFINMGSISRGNILLIPRDLGRRYLDELESLGVVCSGVDGWYYTDVHHNLAEDRDVDFYIGNEALYGPNPIRDSIARAKEFLRTGLLDRTAFVAFTLHIPREVFEAVFLSNIVCPHQEPQY